MVWCLVCIFSPNQDKEQKKSINRTDDGWCDSLLCTRLICGGLMEGSGQSLTMIDKVLSLQTNAGMLSEKHMTHRKCPYSNSRWAATESKEVLWLLNKRPIWTHRHSPVFYPNYTGPLCAFRLTRHNTVIDSEVFAIRAKRQGSLKLCKRSIHSSSHARCITRTVNKLTFG